MQDDRTYFCIDLKSFYASVECVERGQDPFKYKLVVADSSRGEGAICLAVSPALKALGVGGRCRLFEIPKDVEYTIAKPRMKLYMEYSSEIYSIYLSFFCKEDIHVYSVDECFVDVTEYLSLYNMHPRELAEKFVQEIYNKTKITAAVGIGTNLFLAKVALDISAKYSKNFIGYLDLELFKENIWHHKPLSDVWNVGKGISKRLEKYGIYDLYGIATCNEDLLYREFGINAELLIDHAKGIEPCTIKDIHNYKTKNNSLSNSQILFENYSHKDALIVLREMVYQMSLGMVEKNLVCNSIYLGIGYADRKIPSNGGMKKINEYTNAYSVLLENFIDLFNKFANKSYLIRKISIGCNNVIEEVYTCYDLFSNRDRVFKENSVAKSIIEIKKKHGKNSILKGLNFVDKATARERNSMIGGHKSGEDEDN